MTSPRFARPLAGAFLLAAAGLATAIAAAPAAAQDAVADFYKGKTISVTIGADVSGGFNTYARTVWPHLVKHLPGQPNVIFLNMPGAGSRKGASHVAVVAPKDGTHVASVFPGAITAPIFIDAKSVRYDPLTFGYIGSVDSSVYLCVVRKDSGVKTFAEALEKPLVIGGDAKGSNLFFIGNALKNVLGAKFRYVNGYKGSGAIVMAMEQNEVQGICGYGWAAITSQAPRLITEGNLLIQFGLKGAPEPTRMGVPMVWDFVKTPEQKAIFELIAAPQVFGRPYWVPAGVPPERLTALRRAFDKTMADPAFLEEAKKRKLDVSPATGEEVEKLVKGMFATSPELQAKARAAMDAD